MYVIELKEVSKTYNNDLQALKPTTLDIAASSFTVILGPSGAGKSTLLRIINGLENTTSGEVIVLGQKLNRQNVSRLRAKAAMVFQNFNLVGRLNVITNILIGRLHYSPWWMSLLYLFKQKDIEIARWALAKVSLTTKAWERADNLSGGQQQRVGIARALAQQPQIILADEPVASLDPMTSEEILKLLQKICREDGITIVASLHQVDLAMDFADRIIGINSGEVVFDGVPHELGSDRLEKIYRREDGSIDENI
ncbi:MAG: phosphonate ABC transporter ATP-binding protein [Mastigocoleus sp. MO_167.B18]|nr:phosphonate ABC transporter ATP-binding protein [Mastigocoleus sp. MO_167.B18]